MPQDPTATSEAPRRRRGAQPGNANAVKTGQYSRRFRLGLNLFPPRTRRVVALSIYTAITQELGALPYPPPPGAREKACWRALRRVYDCMTTLDFSSGHITHQDIVNCLVPIFAAGAPLARGAKRTKNKRTNRI